MDSLTAAQAYCAKGWVPVPVPRLSKAPTLTGWQKLQLEPTDLPKYFPSATNIGLLLGAASGGLVDVDLDAQPAIDAAPAFLPATNMLHGRPSKPRSHWWYRTDPPPKPKKYQDVDGTCLVELRSTGQQTIVPPSIHPSDEALAWINDGEPKHVDGQFILKAVARLAACALVARNWPHEGARQDCALALAGTLLRAGWTEEEVKTFIMETARVAGDEEFEKRGESVEHTTRRLVNNDPVTGLPKLTELLGDQTVSRLSNWLDLKTPSPQQRGPQQATNSPSRDEVLAELIAPIELFHTPEGDAFAKIPKDNHHEIYAINSKEFSLWLTRMFYQRQGKPLPTQAHTDAIRLFEAQARYRGAEHPVFLRVAQHDGASYLDLCNDSWEVVEITAAGWAVIADSPVRFRRTPGMQALPNPVPGGSLNALRPFVNIAEADSFGLLLAWLVTALRPTGPYPILMLQGEQGSAKSTTARVLRSLVDPSTTPLRSTPSDERDFMISAKNAWVMAFDNLSSVPFWVSDALCRLATGGGYATRALYSNDEQVLFNAQRPVILNGIDDIAARHDLIDRVLNITLPPIPEDKRQPENTFWSEFEAARPHILGALLDAVSEAMCRLPLIQLAGLPRMADFACWASAAENALGWPNGGFMAAYARNRSEAIETGLEAFPIVQAIRTLMDSNFVWKGTPSELLQKLAELTDPGNRESRSWPKHSPELGKQLRRLATALRAVGIEVLTTREGHNSRRMVILRNLGQLAVRAVRNVPDAAKTTGTSRPSNANSTRQKLDYLTPASRPPQTISPTAPADGADSADGRIERVSEPKQQGLWHKIAKLFG